MQEPTVVDLVQLLQGAGTPISGILVFLLWRLNKEVGELKAETKATLETLYRLANGKDSDR